MKLIYLNIFEGCEEPERFERIVSFIKKEDPDILGFTEANHWEDNDFEKVKSFKDKTGFEHSHFCKANSVINLVLFSKHPIKNVEDITKGFRHGLMKAEVEGIKLLLTHLNPGFEEERLLEIDTLLRLVDENTILLGDLNSLSPLDRYNEEELLKEMKELGIKKFGKKKLRYDVQREILNYGLIDCVKLFSDKFQHSVPTTFNKDADHFTKLRLDYIFVSNKFKVKNAKIINTKETNKLSDHFPVILEL